MPNENEIYTLNRLVATEPFPDASIRPPDKTDGFVTTAQRGTLTPLKVVFNSSDDDISLQAGETVWVRAELFKAPWAQQVMIRGDKKFILVPQDLIVLVEMKGLA